MFHAPRASILRLFSNLPDLDGSRNWNEMCVFFRFWLVCEFNDPLVKWNTMSSRHPLKQADRRRVSTHWLGAAQLEAGGSLPIECDDPSHRQVQHVASNSLPIEHGLITREYWLSSCLSHQNGKNGVTSPFKTRWRINLRKNTRNNRPLQT